MELIQKGNNKLAEAGIEMFNLPATKEIRMRLIQWGNKKLGSMLMFNIPASKEICGKVCSGCYSYKAYRMYPNVLPAQTARYEASKSLDFVSRINLEISKIKKPVKYFRIHGSAGEFYSQEYLDKWQSIAEQNPDITFYAYTKRLKTFDFTALKSLDNFILIDSFQTGRLNYGPKDKAPKGVFVCPDQKGAAVRCGIDCTYCMTKAAQASAPYFVQH